MQITNKIDHLITTLIKLKTSLSIDSSNNEKRFNDLLTASIEINETATNEDIEVTLSAKAKPENEVPSWVDPDYSYDPQNPRKPNMRELMQAMSGKDLEDLYKATDGDWLSIMTSNDIVTKAREQTGAM